MIKLPYTDVDHYYMGDWTNKNGSWEELKDSTIVGPPSEHTVDQLRAQGAEEVVKLMGRVREDADNEVIIHQMEDDTSLLYLPYKGKMYQINHPKALMHWIKTGVVNDPEYVGDNSEVLDL